MAEAELGVDVIIDCRRRRRRRCRRRLKILVGLLRMRRRWGSMFVWFVIML